MMCWKLVPVMPSEGMQKAWGDCDHEETAVGDWTVMLAAAPPASQDEELVARASLEIARIAMGYDTEHDYRAQARAVLKMLEGGE